ncbi:MAG: mammalian cell entry protein [Conexibacter sp.]|nr:mammalian cell entry protein [Conexibacter sp.]
MSLLPSPRRSRRRDSRSTASILLSAAVVFGLIGLYTVITVRAPRQVPLLGYRTITASLPDVGNLRIHSEVRARGVRLGEVTSVSSDHGRAHVRLKLDPSVGDLPIDTTAAIRGKGVLGARFVELQLGNSARPLPSGGTVHEASNPITLGLTDALDTFDTQTRGGLRSTVTALGTGFLGRGRELNDTLRRTPAALADMHGLIDTLDTRPGAVRRLLPAVDDLMAPLSEAREDIARGFDPTARALAPFVDRREALRAALDVAPSALLEADRGLSDGRRLLTSVGELATAANVALARAPLGLRAATRLLMDAPAPLRRSRVLLRKLRPAVPALLRVTSGLSPLLGPLRHVIVQVNPVVVRFGEHGCDFIDFGDNMRSVLNQGVPGGRTSIGPQTSLRFTVIGSAESVSNLGTPPPNPADGQKYPPPCKFSVPPHTYGSGG